MAFYRKKGIQELVPWTPKTDMDGVSVSDADFRDGSPKEGDMIALNPRDPSDRWLVAERFFKDNYELVSGE